VVTQHPPLPRRLLAELLGSAFLAALVIGSGIAAQKLLPDNVGLQLFQNAAATAARLFAIILIFGPVSGEDLAGPVAAVPDPSSLRRAGETFGILGRGLRYKLHLDRSASPAPAV
jgi:hypothetical protein